MNIGINVAAINKLVRKAFRFVKVSNSFGSWEKFYT